MASIVPRTTCQRRAGDGRSRRTRVPIHLHNELTDIMSVTIDPRAVVSPKAHLGTNVSIGPFTIVEDGAVIGDGTTVAANALIATGARIGRDCRIHHGAVDRSCAAGPQVRERADHVRDRATGTRSANTPSSTGAPAMRGGRSSGATTSSWPTPTSPTTACSGPRHHGQRGDARRPRRRRGLGHHRRDHPRAPVRPHRPARHDRRGTPGAEGRSPVHPRGERARWSSKGSTPIGLRRRGFSPEAIDALDRAYTLIYRSKLNVSQAVARIREDPALMRRQGGAERRRVHRAGARRGIISGPRLRA